MNHDFFIDDIRRGNLSTFMNRDSKLPYPIWKYSMEKIADQLVEYIKDNNHEKASEYYFVLGESHNKFLVEHCVKHDRLELFQFILNSLKTPFIWPNLHELEFDICVPQPQLKERFRTFVQQCHENVGYWNAYLREGAQQCYLHEFIDFVENNHQKDWFTYIDFDSIIKLCRNDCLDIKTYLMIVKDPKELKDMLLDMIAHNMSDEVYNHIKAFHTVVEQSPPLKSYVEELDKILQKPLCDKLLWCVPRCNYNVS